MGERAGATSHRKTGTNAGVSTAEVDVRSEDANLTYQTSAVACEIVSSSTSDDYIPSGTLTLAGCVPVTAATGTVTLASALPIAAATGTVQFVNAVANTFATGTVTAASVQAADTVTINGLVYTAVAGAKADNTQFSIDTGDNECAADLAASITADARAGTVGDTTAVAVGAVVTITTTVTGTGGNAVTLVSSNGTRLAVSGAGTLTGGVTADTITANGLVYTAVAGVKANNTQFSIDTSNNAAAADFADSVNNDVRAGTLNDLSAVAVTDTVTLTQTVAGAGGNATTLTSSSTGVRLITSGATFANGRNADTVTINGLVYTAVAGARANNTQFSIDTSDTAAATDLAAAITADSRSGTLNDVTATSLNAVVTCTQTVSGAGGNATTLVSSNGTRLAVSGAGTFTGGLDADVATVNGLTYTGVAGVKANNTQFSTDGDDTANAADLAASINADTRTPVTVPTVDVSATSAAGVVTISATTGGTAGNTIDISGTSNITASGATLTDSSAVGAWTVYIEGLDASYNIVTETINLNGTVPMPLANNYYRINNANVVTVGTNGVNVGTITIRKVSGAVNQLEIPAGDGQSQSTSYTVPINKVFHLKQIDAETSQVAGNAVVTRIKGYYREPGESWRDFETITQGNGSYTREFNNDEYEFPAGTDIRFTAIKQVGTGDVTVDVGYSFKLS